jgi:hypothetical protein
VEVTLVGEIGLSYVIYASTNLTTWTPISTNVIPPSGTLKFLDTPNLSQRFYRATRLTP